MTDVITKPTPEYLQEHFPVGKEIALSPAVLEKMSAIQLVTGMLEKAFSNKEGIDKWQETQAQSQGAPAKIAEELEPLDWVSRAKRVQDVMMSTFGELCADRSAEEMAQGSAISRVAEMPANIDEKLSEYGMPGLSPVLPALGISPLALSIAAARSTLENLFHHFFEQEMLEAHPEIRFLLGPVLVWSIDHDAGVAKILEHHIQEDGTYTLPAETLDSIAAQEAEHKAQEEAAAKAEAEAEESGA